MIRRATIDDVPIMAVYGEQFFDEAGWGDVASYDLGDCAASLAQMVESDDAIMLVADEGEIVGMVAGVIFPLYFNRAHRTGQELFYWVRPGDRNGIGRALLRALADEAKARGCKSWSMIALDKVRPEATGMMYRREGYRPSEHSYIKVL